VEVYRERSITDAAVVLLLSQPTVSRALKSLEDRLSILLFERTKIELVPTEAADTLYPRAVIALREIDAAFDDLHGSVAPDRVAVGTTPELLMLVAPTARMGNGDPGDLDHLEARTGDQLIERLRNKVIDLVIIPGLGDQIPVWAHTTPVRTIQVALHHPTKGLRAEILALPPEGSWERSVLRGLMGGDLPGPSFGAAGGGVSKRLLREGFSVFLPVGCADDLDDVQIVEPIHTVTVKAITRDPVVEDSPVFRIIERINRIAAEP